MAVNQATGYNRTTKEPLDALYLNSGSVYTSIAAVNAAVNINVRYTGSRFNINGEDYWYKNGVQDSDLVVCVDKLSFATTASNHFQGNQEVVGYTRYLPSNISIPVNLSGSFVYSSGSLGDLYFAQSNGVTQNVTRLRWIEGNMYTGLLSGGVLSTGSSTTYQVSSGSGIIVTMNVSLNAEPYPTIDYISWPNLSASIAPLSASYDQTFVAVRPTGSTGYLFGQGVPYSDGQYDTMIPIGVVLHQNHSTINLVKTAPSVGYGLSQRNNVFIKAFGPLKLSGLVFSPSGSSTGSLVVSSGTAYTDGANYTTDPSNPSYITDAGTTTSKVWRYYQSGSSWVYDTNAGAGYPTIDPTKYSLNGTLTTVPGTGANREYSIQRVYWFTNSVSKAIVVYYGNATYTTKTDAIANVNVESFTEAPNTAANAVYLGAIVIRNNGSFQDPSSYAILPGGLFRQVGGSGGGGSVITQLLSGLSDVYLNGVTSGQGLVYDVALAKWVNSSYLSASVSGTASFANVADIAPKYTPSSSFNAYTQSVNVQLSNIYISESNYLPTASFNPISSSFDARVLANSASIYSIVHNSGSLETLTDVVLASLTPGQALVYDTGTSKWKNASYISASISGNAATATNVAASGVTSPGALTRTNDTNVTLTLGGSPTTALLAATSITVGWTGTLADARITSATNWNAAYAYSLVGHLPLAGGNVSGNILMSGGAAIDATLTAGTDVLNIGTSNADTINIGWSGATVNIQGTVMYNNVTNLQVKDKLITVNKGGAAASGTSSGFEVEEAGVITGYFATDATRTGWDFKAPASQQLTLGLDLLSAARIIKMPDASGTIALLTSLSSTATGLTYTNTTGVFSLTSGYVIPTTTEQSTWNAKIGGSGTTGTIPKFSASGTLTDSIITESGSRIRINGNGIEINGPATSYRELLFLTSAGARFNAYVIGAETGSNAGSTFYFSRYDDAGAYIEDVFSVNRATGITSFNRDIVINSLAGGLAGNFVVNNSGKLVTRTAAQVLADIGAAPATGGAYLPLVAGVGSPLTGTLFGVSSSWTGDASFGYNNAVTFGAYPYRFKIARSSAGDLPVYFDDEYDNALSSINFRMRTTGTIFTPLVLKYNNVNTVRLNVNGATDNISYALNVTGAGLFSSSIFATRVVMNNSTQTQGEFWGWNNINGASANAGEIRLGGTSSIQGRLIYSSSGNTTVYLDNTFDDVAAEIKLRTRVAGTAVEVLKLQSETAKFSGRVNVNGATDNSSYQLNVSGASNLIGLVNIGGSTSGIRLGNIGDNSAYDNVKITYSGYNAGVPEVIFTPRTTPGSGVVTTFFRFQNTNGNANPLNNFASVTIDGNLGVGVTDPSYKLHVAGAGYFTGSATASSFIKSGGTSSQYLMADGSVSSGGGGTGTTYSPTLTNTLNISSSSLISSALYSRSGNIVTCTISVNVTPTSGSNTWTQLDFTLPVTTGTTTQNYIGTCFAWRGTFGTAKGVVTITGANSGSATFLAIDTTACSVVIQFQYLV